MNICVLSMFHMKARYRKELQVKRDRQAAWRRAHREEETEVVDDRVRIVQVHCGGTLGLECKSFKEEQWGTTHVRNRWILQELREMLRRKTEDRRGNDPRRAIKEPEARPHEKRTPDQVAGVEKATSRKGMWFHGDTEWLAAMVPRLSWRQLE